MAGGNITRITEGDFVELSGGMEIYAETFDITAGKQSRLGGKAGTVKATPKDMPSAGKYFVKGWWTNHKDEPIKRAIYGQRLRFHIEMDKTYTKTGDVVYFALFDSDMRSFGNDVIKADDPINLEHKDGSHKPYINEYVDSDFKIIIEFSTTDNLEQWTKQLDQDKIFELYFRCSYVNEDIEHVELPNKFQDYLQLGSIVIDRYKMPGLNAAGTDIADDMTFGTGNNHSLPIYPTDVVAQYKEEYILPGFSTSQHGVFSNANDFDFKPLMKEKEEEEKPRFSILIEEPIDNTSVVINNGINPIKNMNFTIAYQNKNRKALYSEKEILELGNLMEFSNYTDFRLWFNFRTLKALLAWGDLSPILDEMIDKFERSEGGIYKNPILTEAIQKNINTQDYLQKVEDYMADQLKTNFKTLEKMEDVEPYFEKQIGDLIIFKNIKGERIKTAKKNFSKPAYTYLDSKNLAGNLISGKTLALNDIWATEVYLKQVVFEGDNYTAKYQVTLWDHFGLDKPDMEKFYYGFNGFRAWFLLQHIKGFKPFITKMNFTQVFKGNINKGMAELNAERQQIKAAAAQRDKEKAEMMREVLKGPKY